MKLTTEIMGATRFSDCKCPAERYFEPRQVRCIKCDDGLDCLGGFSPFEPSGGTVKVGDSTVVVQEGYLVVTRLTYSSAEA